jgi:hypothetical protein
LIIRHALEQVDLFIVDVFGLLGAELTQTGSPAITAPRTIGSPASGGSTTISRTVVILLFVFLLLQILVVLFFVFSFVPLLLLSHRISPSETHCPLDPNASGLGTVKFAFSFRSGGIGFLFFSPIS